MEGPAARVAGIVPCFDDGALVREAVGSVQEDEPVEIVDDQVLRQAHPGGAGQAGGERHDRDPSRGQSGRLERPHHRSSSIHRSVRLSARRRRSRSARAPGRAGRSTRGGEGRRVVFGDYQEFGDAQILRAVPPRIDPFRITYSNEYPISALFRRGLLEQVGGFRPAGYGGRSYEDWNLWMSLAEVGEQGLHAGVGVPVYRRRLHGGRKLESGKRNHTQLYHKLKAAHPRLFDSVAEHKRASDLSSTRKLLYPLVYGGRRRFRFEAHIKAGLDRLGVWTLRR